VLRRPVETAPFISQEATLAFAARPVRIIRLAGRKARGRALRSLRVWDPDQGGAFFSLSLFGQRGRGAGNRSVHRARPFGREVMALGELGRWPDRQSYPPGGGCGFVAGTTSHPAFLEASRCAAGRWVQPWLAVIG
jgi:hypothetical protein